MRIVNRTVFLSPPTFPPDLPFSEITPDGIRAAGGKVLDFGLRAYLILVGAESTFGATGIITDNPTYQSPTLFRQVRACACCLWYHQPTMHSPCWTRCSCLEQALRYANVTDDIFFNNRCGESSRCTPAHACFVCALNVLRDVRRRLNMWPSIYAEPGATVWSLCLSIVCWYGPFSALLPCYQVNSCC